jgi:hypothetical protein
MMPSATLSTLDQYPDRFFTILETVGKTIRAIVNFIVSPRLSEQEIYLSQAVDYSDFESRLKRLRHTGKF